MLVKASPFTAVEDVSPLIYLQPGEEVVASLTKSADNVWEVVLERVEQGETAVTILATYSTDQTAATYTNSGTAPIKVRLRCTVLDLVTEPTLTVAYTFATTPARAVTQATNKSTDFTLNAMQGRITFNNAALDADAIVSATWTNAFIDENTVISFNHLSGGTVGKYKIDAAVANGSAVVTLVNISAGSLSEAPCFQFILRKV